MLYYYNPTRQLYIDLDTSKEFSFEAHIYHTKADTVTAKGQAHSEGIQSSKALNQDEAPKQKSIQPILFLSRQLTLAETRY